MRQGRRSSSAEVRTGFDQLPGDLIVADQWFRGGIPPRDTAAYQNRTRQEFIARDARIFRNKDAVGAGAAAVVTNAFRSATEAHRVNHLVQDFIAEGGIAAVLSFGPNLKVIGVGMWLAIIMAANVWFVIWPNQKRALGIVQADDASKAKSARVAMIASRINTVLSIPMLYCMVMQGGVPV